MSSHLNHQEVNNFILFLSCSYGLVILIVAKSQSVTMSGLRMFDIDFNVGVGN